MRDLLAFTIILLVALVLGAIRDRNVYTSLTFSRQTQDTTTTDTIIKDSIIKQDGTAVIIN